jgi:hypothetical protein
MNYTFRSLTLDRDDWEGNHEDGVYIPEWIADFSENMCLVLYQKLTIREWFNSKPEIIERKRQCGVCGFTNEMNT